jgi:hypothetical protein
LPIGQTLLSGQLGHALLELSNLGLAALEQITQRATLLGRFRVQGKIDPADFYVFFGLQAFNTNCTEITPGSDEVGKDLNNDWILHMQYILKC